MFNVNSTADRKLKMSYKMACTHFAPRAAVDAVGLPSKIQKKGHQLLLLCHQSRDLIVITTLSIFMPERSRASTSSDRLRCFGGGSKWWLGIRINFVKYDIFFVLTFLSSCGSFVLSQINNGERFKFHSTVNPEQISRRWDVYLLFTSSAARSLAFQTICAIAGSF